MYALIKKDLRIFSNYRKYLIIQFVVISILVLILFLGTIEFYAQGIDTNHNVKLIDVGKQIYTLFILCIFLSIFLGPRYAVDAFDLEISGGNVSNSGNLLLLNITPLGNCRIIAAKLIAIVIWSVWLICITLPLFALSSYLGGISIELYLHSGIVILVSCLFFAIVGSVCALWLTPIKAKAVSYAIVMTINFLPLLPISPIADLPFLTKISAAASLFSILQTPVGNLWVWNVGLYCVLSLMILPVLVWRLSKL